MDINLLRAILTLLLFVGFCSLIILVLMHGNKGYDEAANLPFIEPDDHE